MLPSLSGLALHDATGGVIEDVKAKMKRAKVGDSRTALEQCQRHASEQQETIQQLTLQLQGAQEKEKATREEAEYDKRELEQARGSLRLRLQKLQKQLHDRASLNSQQIAAMQKELAQARSELAERDLEIARYSEQVGAANQALEALKKELEDLPIGMPVDKEFADVIEAAKALQSSVDVLTQENSRLHSQLDELRRTLSSDRAVCDGLAAQIDALSATFIAKLAKRADADCDRALGVEPKFNTELFLAIATARPEKAISLIHKGATLDTGPPSDNTRTYQPIIEHDWTQGVFASAVLFENLRWVGDTLDKYKADFSMRSFLNGSRTSSRAWEMADVRYQKEEDPERVQAMLSILDALADNPCPLNAGFKFYIPLHANPINWSPELVEHAYAKKLMPAETTWSLLNGVLLWAHLSPLLFILTSSDSGHWALQWFGGQTANWTGQEYIAYDKRLMNQAKAMIKLAERLGQTNFKQGETRGLNKYASSTNFGQDVTRTSERHLAEVTSQARRDRRHVLHDVVDDALLAIRERKAWVQEIRAQFGMETPW